MDISDLNFKPCQCEYQVPNLPPFFIVLSIFKTLYRAPDLPILLESHSNEPQQQVPCLQEGLL